MEHLPFEVLINIFRRLHYLEKVQLSLVSKRFSHVLQNGYLYETLPELASFSISHSPGTMTKLKEARPLGSKCQQMKLNDAYTEKTNITELMTWLPNIRLLDADTCLFWQPNTENSTSTEHWEGCLQVIHEKGPNDSIIPNLLGCGVLTKLETLSTYSTLADMSDLVSDLKNAPALKSLTLKVSNMTLPQLDELHQSTPNPVSFTLSFGLLSNITGNLDSQQPTPAHNVKALKLLSLDNSISQAKLLKYATTKYQHLTEFEYQGNGTRNMLLAESIQHNGLTLTRLSLDPTKKKAPTVDSVATSTPNLTNLSIKVHDDTEILATIISNRTHNKLRSLHLHRIPLSYNMTHLRSFRQLVDLELDFGTGNARKVIPEMTIVDKLRRSLITLTLKNCEISTATVKPTRDSNISKPAPTNVKYMEDDISSLLKRNFTNLTTLIIVMCDNISKINLPDHSLDLFEFIPVFDPKNGGYCRIKTHQQDSCYQLPKSKSENVHSREHQASSNNNHDLQRGILNMDEIEDIEYECQLDCTKVRLVYLCGYEFVVSELLYSALQQIWVIFFSEIKKK